MATEIAFCSRPLPLAEAQALVLIGRRDRLAALQPADLAALLPADAAGLLPGMLEAVTAGDDGGAASSFLPATDGGAPKRFVVGVLPEACSRHNSRARPHAVAGLLSKHTPPGANISVVLACDEAELAFATGCAAARAWAVYSRKSGPSKDRKVHLSFLPGDRPLDDAELSRIAHAAAGIRLAARLVEMPTADLHTDAFIDEIRHVAADTGATMTILRDDVVQRAGLGGLWAVGKAAVRPPALVILTHSPEGAQKTVAWVGKGIVYDTGGLSLKGKSDMPGMKRDMGGAAAVLGAFAAAVHTGFPDTLHAVLCLAENAIGPDALRPDDIITLYSGKTVEVNNTDAEGRLVLADGIAWTLRNLVPDALVDMATLTGAALISTGKRHAAIVSNCESMEAACVEAGRQSGDLVHPLPYCPEMFRGEFKSDVADLKNSVKDRMNAQSSCAAQFIAEHLGDFTGPWLHVDMAGPVEADNRATGYGVALLLTLFEGGALPAA